MNYPGQRVLMWTTIALALLSWPIIGQLTINALGYMLFGLGIAALRNRPVRDFSMAGVQDD